MAKRLNFLIGLTVVNVTGLPKTNTCGLVEYYCSLATSMDETLCSHKKAMLSDARSLNKMEELEMLI